MALTLYDSFDIYCKGCKMKITHMETLSKTQIDKLGERMKAGSSLEDDLRLLDSYRRSFSVSYDNGIRSIRDNLKWDPTGRPAKSTSSVIDKLRRESIRLTQIQDIAGCRIVVDDLLEQTLALVGLNKVFPSARIINRLQHPSFGYRAIHIIPVIEGLPIEVQVRSLLQHLWAELSEKYSDKFGQDIKYGGGTPAIRSTLDGLSGLIADYENMQARIIESIMKDSDDDSKGKVDDGLRRLNDIRSISSAILAVIKIANNSLDQEG